MYNSIAKTIDSNRTNRAGSFYPSKLFSLSDYYLPENIKEIFHYCKYLVLTDPAVSGAVHKLSESPITDLMYDHENTATVDRYKDLMEKKLRVRERLLEGIFDLVVYSNAFLSFEVPVTRYLISPNLHQDIRNDARAVGDGKMDEHVFDIKYKDQIGGGRKLNRRFRADQISWEMTGNGQFKGPCPVSGKTVLFERQDRYYPSSDNVSIKKWDPNRVTIQHNEITGKNKYYYELAYSTKELIKMNDRDHLIEDPWEYIIAARDNRNVRIRNEQLYHLSNVKISGAFNGWGLPRLFSAFKLIFYYMTLLRANEATAIGRINDLTILFPQSQSGLLDPASAVPGSNFRRNMAAMIKAHQRDKNYVGISPIPIGSLSVFGQGRMQLVSAELEPVVRMICVALGLPYDMLFGGGAYTGQAVGQRVFTAQTGLSRERFNEFLDFMVQKTSNALGKDRFSESMKITLKEAEGPDDIQRKQMRMQMALNNKASLRTAMEDLGMDSEKEFENMEEEAKKLNRSQLIQAKGQALAQAEGQEILSRSQQKLEESQQQQGGDPMMGGQEGGMMPPGQENGIPGMDQGQNLDQDGNMMPSGMEDPNAPPQEEGGVPADTDPNAQPPTPEDEQKAHMFHSYIQQNPELQQEIMDYAWQNSPKAFEVLQQLIKQEDGTSTEIPDLPALDTPSYQFGSENSGVEVGNESGVPDQLPGKNQ